MLVSSCRRIAAPRVWAGRDEHRAAHRAWLADLVEKKTVITSGPYADDSGAFIVVDADTAESVEQLFTQDSFVTHGLVSAHRIIERTPVLGTLIH